MIASTVGWTLDSFDYFVVVMVLTEIANEFHRTNAEIALTLTITLAFRPIGAFIFGLLADRYGRRVPLMIDVVAYSILSVASGLAPNFTTFVVLRALFGIAMGGEWGAGASLVMEKVSPKWRGLLSGVLQQGYTTGYMLASVAYFFVLPRFGWRAMFLVGGAPALLAFFIRTRVKESEVWEKTHRKDWSQLGNEVKSHTWVYLGCGTIAVAVARLAGLSLAGLESRSGPSETVFLSRTVPHVHGFLRTRHARHVSYVFENATRFLGTGRGSDDRHCQSWSARRRHSDRTYLRLHRQAQVDRVRTRTGDADRPIVGVLAHNRFAGCGSVPAAIHSTWRMGCRPGSHFGTGAGSYSWVSAGVCVSVRNTARRQCDLPGSGLCRPNQLFQCHGADGACRFCRYGHHHLNRSGEKRRPVRLGTLTNPRLRHLYRHAEMTLLIMTNATTRSSSVMVCRVSSTLSVLPSFRRCFAVATSTRFGK